MYGDDFNLQLRCGYFVAMDYVLKNSPEVIKWSKAHKLHLRRNENQELGVMINTFKSEKRRETYTVVTKVKEECVEKDPNKLSAGFRILKICKDKIHTWDIDRVEDKIKKLREDPDQPVTFKLCAPKPKWIQNYLTQINNNLITGIQLAGPSSTPAHQLQGSPALVQNPAALQGAAIEPMRQCPRPAGKGLTLQGPPASVSTHQLQGSHSGSLTPVDDIMPHLHTTSRDASAGFSSLQDIQDVEEQSELVREAIERPWNICWAVDIRTITIMRMRDRPTLGISYKHLVNPNKDQDTYCIIDDVKPDSPAKNTLHCGDLVHSVNSSPIKDKSTLKNMITSSQTAPLKMCIQRPEKIINPGLAEQSRRNNLSPPDNKSGSCPNNSQVDEVDTQSWGFRSLAAETLHPSEIVINTSLEPSENGTVLSNNTKCSSGLLPKGPRTTQATNGSLTRASNSSSESSVSNSNSKSKGKRPTKETKSNERKLINSHRITSNPNPNSPGPSSQLPSYIPKPLKQRRVLKRAASTEDMDTTSRVSISTPLPGFVKGHRRNLSDSSSVMYAQKMNGVAKPKTAHGTVTKPKAGFPSCKSNELTRSVSSSSYQSCLQHGLTKWWESLAKRSTQHFPYVRFIQMSTSDSHNMQIHNHISCLLKVNGSLSKWDSPHAFRGNFALFGDQLRRLVHDLDDYSIEDIILARYGSSYMIDLRFVRENKTEISKLLRNSKSNVEHLMGCFLDNPMDPDAHLVGFESLVLNFPEVCKPEYNVLYSDNSIFIVTVDVNRFSSPASSKDELGRISVCLNNIRLRCKNAQVCFVIDSSYSDEVDCECEQIAADRLAELRRTKRICGCGQGMLEIHQNDATDFPLFNLTIPKHAQQLQQVLMGSVKSVVDSGFPGRVFPLLALKVKRMLEEEEASPITTQITSMLRKLYPDVEYMDDVMRHVLASLHAAGKIVNPSDMQHATINEKLLQMFILHRPRALISCMAELRRHHSDGVFTEHLSSSSTASARHRLALLNDPSLIYYLRLFHCIERTATGAANDGYWYLPDNPFNAAAANQTAPRDEPVTTSFLLDFDGFLPLAAVPVVLCALGRAFLEGGTTMGPERLGACGARYDVTAWHTRAEVRLDPLTSTGTVHVHGPEGVKVCQVLRQVAPDWLTINIQSDNRVFNGFNNSYASLSSLGMNTPVAECPLDLLHVISTCLHPSTSPRGNNDVRLLAELLCVGPLPADVALKQDATITLLQCHVANNGGGGGHAHTTLTLGQLLTELIGARMGRRDVERRVFDWLSKSGIA